MIPLRFFDILAFEVMLSIPICLLIIRSVGRPVRLPMMAACLTVSAVALLVSSMRSLPETGLRPGLVRHLLIVFPLTLTVTIAAHVARGKKSTGSEHRPHPPIALVHWLTAIAVLLIPAGIYQANRTSDGLEQLGQLQSQSRLGELAELSGDLLVLSPRLMYRDESLRRAHRDWKTQCAGIERSLVEVDSVEQKARLLAILGRRHEALEILQPVLRTDSPSPSACLLAATICEHNFDWSSSEHWYERAKRLTNDTMPDHKTVLLTALRGIGLTNRKQGQNTQAEAAYLELLKRQPTADSHLLLARFYEDAQVGEKAAFHLEQAVRHGDAHHRTAAAKMWPTLRSYQFGCLRIRSVPELPSVVSPD